MRNAPTEAPAETFEGKPWIHTPSQLAKTTGIVYLGDEASLYVNPELPSKSTLQAMSEKDLRTLARELRFKPKGTIATLPAELFKVIEAQKHILERGLNNFDTHL